MKGFIGTIFLVGLLALCSSTGYACFCSPSGVPEAFERANAVFVGEVVDIVEPETSDEKAPLPGRFFTLKFRVEKLWKGVASNEVDVLSTQGRYGCFAFPPASKGEKYLVYADLTSGDEANSKGWLIITACTRTALLPRPEDRVVDRFHESWFNRKDATEDLKQLEQLKQMPKPLSDFRSPDFRWRSNYEGTLPRMFQVYY